MIEPIFKGATRPAMLWGVPLLPLLLTLVAAFLTALWTGILLSWWIALGIGALVAPGVWWMRRTTRRDDQRLRQIALWARLALAQRNRRLWGSRSYGPLVLRGTSDAWRR